jgi:hypothetical protein
MNYYNEGEGSSDISRSGKKGVTHAVEILGLTNSEIYQIEGDIFNIDYKSIDLDKVAGVISPGLDQPEEDFRIVKKYSYIAEPDSFNDTDRMSIEEDILSEGALIYEESVNDLKRKLSELMGHDQELADESISNISDAVIIIDDDEDVKRFSEGIPDNKRENIKKLLKYLDGLFEKLPEDVIKKFADSEYYNLYVQILNYFD